jgi:uncharacterized membrane protein
MYIAILLASLMTLITASSNILLKKGFLKIDPFLATYISVLINTVFLWIATFLFVDKSFYGNYRGILVFVAIGCFTPVIVRSLTYYGIHLLGPGLSAALRGMTPFFATLMAIIFLKESPRPALFLGLALIVLGLVLLAKRDKGYQRVHNRLYFVYPLAAAVLAGLAANLRKYGLNFMPHPVFASAIAATTSLLPLTIYVLFKYGREEIMRLMFQKRELGFIFISALLISFGEIVDLSALLFGRVSLVVPIYAATPLVIIFFSRLFLKDQEVVTKKLVFSSLAVICGICLAVISAR